MSCYNDKGHGHGGKHDNCCDRRPGGIGMPDNCCTGTKMCTDFNKNLSNVKVEPIYTQKVYDAALFHLQSIINGMEVPLTPKLSNGTRIVEVLDIRCKKRFDPTNTKCGRNLTMTPNTTLQGADFVSNGNCDVTAVGPDGFHSQKLIYVDTEDCDEKCKGTPVYGTQTINITGYVDIEIDVNVRENCGRRCKVTLRGSVPVAPNSCGLNLTNFFELCVPSTTSGAFFPRFTEFCNMKCQPRLATNNINRDFKICEKDGTVKVNMMIALCVSCEKKIIVPVQLCVLSTGFTKLSPETSSVCSSYPSLFPNQIDKDSVKECLDNKGDKDDKNDCYNPCKPNRPSNNNSYRGLSLSDDETNDLE